ncbi:hypothetical protein [Aestuariivivens sediminis]|uniref:hypothetical protein n=1 Tax=Aestuariivivens sediminis TaxID=2913557 RepID=UPI001F5A3B20|nr:hypothetical protein [Aestuariivivens sediminis]
MNKRELRELLKYCNPRELYIIAWNNLLKRLFCPFRVAVIDDIGQLKKGEIVMIDEIKVTMDLKTVYLIKGSYYYYHHFDILID